MVQTTPTKPPPAHIVFAQLRDALAYLYRDMAAAQLIVDDLGLAADRIAFTTSAQINWHRILALVVRQGKLAELLARVRQDYPDSAPFEAAVTAYEALLAHGGNLATIPEEPPATPNGLTARTKNNPWTSGTFYLLVFVVVMATLIIAAKYVDWYLLPAILIAALLAVPLIGVLQALNDETLSEKGFLQVVLESYRRLPLLRGKDR